MKIIIQKLFPKNAFMIEINIYLISQMKYINIHGINQWKTKIN